MGYLIKERGKDIRQGNRCKLCAATGHYSLSAAGEQVCYTCSHLKSPLCIGQPVRVKDKTLGNILFVYNGVASGPTSDHHLVSAIFEDVTPKHPKKHHPRFYGVWRNELFFAFPYEDIMPGEERNAYYLHLLKP